MAFYGRFKSLLVHYINKPDLPTVVALFLCGACLVQYGKQSAGWVFCGMVYRMIFDLGYHLEDRKPSHSGDDMILSPWSERSEEEYTRVPMPPTNLNPFISVKIRLCTCPRPVYLGSFLTLSRSWKNGNLISTPMLSYAMPRPRCTAVDLHSLSARHGVKSLHSLLETRQQIMMKLDEWRSGLPSHLWFDPRVDDPPPPHQMILYTAYWTLVILTQQPFTTQNRFGLNLHAKVKHEAIDKCIEAAFNIRALAEAYQRAFTLRRPQFGISYAMHSAVLILLQSDSQGRDDYNEACRFFWSALLEYQKGCGSGLKKPLALLKSLMLRVAKLAPCITDNTSDAVPGGLFMLPTSVLTSCREPSHSGKTAWRMYVNLMSMMGPNIRFLMMILYLVSSPTEQLFPRAALSLKYTFRWGLKGSG
ncbi:hypothetical protein AFLA70_466g000801 [Aspergillus flavus AF70]|nr:hypothetical protein AFLA70_466g000801 [Aspergillus flavus AF70]